MLTVCLRHSLSLSNSLMIIQQDEQKTATQSFSFAWTVHCLDLYTDCSFINAVLALEHLYSYKCLFYRYCQILFKIDDVIVKLPFALCALLCGVVLISGQYVFLFFIYTLAVRNPASDNCRHNLTLGEKKSYATPIVAVI